MNVEGSVSYPFVWSRQIYGAKRLVAALVAALLGMFVLLTTVVPVVLLAAAQVGLVKNDGLGSLFTPTADNGVVFFFANNLAIIGAILVAWLVTRFLFGQKMSDLITLTGTVRWGWMVRNMLILIPVYLVVKAVTYLVAPAQFEGLAWNEHTTAYIVAIVLTTPFQAIAEEILFRGVIFRATTSFFVKNRVVGMAIGVGVTAIAFASLHGASNIWSNLAYLSMSAIACWMVVASGGLESVIAFHVVNNLFALSTVPFAGAETVFSRGASAGGPEILIEMLPAYAACIFLVYLARKNKLVNTTKLQPSS